MVQLKYCKACGDSNHGNLRGSFLIFFILCLFFLVPGLIYLTWMLVGGQRKCRACGTWGMIPANSPAAVAALTPPENVVPIKKRKG